MTVLLRIKNKQALSSWFETMNISQTHNNLNHEWTNNKCVAIGHVIIWLSSWLCKKNYMYIYNHFLQTPKSYSSSISESYLCALVLISVWPQGSNEKIDFSWTKWLYTLWKGLVYYCQYFSQRENWKNSPLLSLSMLLCLLSMMINPCFCLMTLTLPL